MSGFRQIEMDGFVLQVREKGENVTNPYSGVTRFLVPEAVALYDLIKGAERLGDYNTVQRALAHFARRWPSEYMDLLD